LFKRMSKNTNQKLAIKTDFSVNRPEFVVVAVVAAMVVVAAAFVVVAIVVVATNLQWTKRSLATYKKMNRFISRQRYVIHHSLWPNDRVSSEISEKNKVADKSRTSRNVTSNIPCTIRQGKVFLIGHIRLDGNSKMNSSRC
jgi:hypothetical protein